MRPPRRPFDLAHPLTLAQTALITGGGSGLGQMAATALVQNGAHVIIASRKEPQLKELSEALTKAGPGKCSYFIADVSSKVRLARAMGLG